MLIKKPLCLRDIERNLKNDKYKSFSQFMHDLRLIVLNCIYYNMLNNEDQTSNRRQAYLLHREFFTLSPNPDEKLDSTIQANLRAVEKVFFDLIESIYAIQRDNYQLIRYFALDTHTLLNYDRYIKKPINLSSILVGPDCCHEIRDISSRWTTRVFLS